MDLLREAVKGRQISVLLLNLESRCWWAAQHRYIRLLWVIAHQHFSSLELIDIRPRFLLVVEDLCVVSGEVIAAEMKGVCQLYGRGFDSSISIAAATSDGRYLPAFDNARSSWPVR